MKSFPVLVDLLPKPTRGKDTDLIILAHIGTHNLLDNSLMAQQLLGREKSSYSISFQMCYKYLHSTFSTYLVF